MDSAFTLDCPRMEIIHTWFSSGIGQSMAHITLYVICCLEHKSFSLDVWQADDAFGAWKCTSPSQPKCGPCPGCSVNGPSSTVPPSFFLCRYYSASIIKMAGVNNQHTAIWLSAMTAGVNFVFTLVGVWLVERIGRKPLLLFSLAGVCLCALMSVCLLLLLSRTFTVNIFFFFFNHY